MAAFVGNLADTLNGYIWAMPLIYLCLGGGLIFTIALRGVQVRHLGDMTRLPFNGQRYQSGFSSFHAFCMAIAGRVGTGNIAGVATAIFYGGPGALFWMWMVAILGAATTFIECTMAQLFKEKVNNQCRGGTTYYISKFFKSGALGYVFSVVAMISLAMTQTGIHSNTIAESVLAAFSIPKWITALVICVALAAIIFGGVKRIGAVAEKVVPVMAGIYIIVALIVLVLNISQVPAVFRLIFTSAFGKDQIIGAAFGSAVIWGTKRAVFSTETGMSTATQAAASAEVSHPVKQGLVQAFSVYIDTLFVCTATGIMLLLTGCYNVTDGAGGLLVQNISADVSAGAPWVQMALNTHFSWGGAFTAYCIGAGFASGQETLQYYGSWGGAYPFILPVLTFVLLALFCYGTYKTGYIKRFPDPDVSYNYYCGKVLGKILDIFCTLSIALSTLIMFAGSGATVNQYLGIPVWVGTLVMGVVSVVVVCLGLEKVTNVLGFVGTLIIIILMFTEGKAPAVCEKHTLGIITAGTYTFGVGDREVVTLISGEVEVKRPVDADWVKFKPPEAFEIQANCEYDIRTYGVAEYLCDYHKECSPAAGRKGCSAAASPIYKTESEERLCLPFLSARPTARITPPSRPLLTRSSPM